MEGEEPARAPGAHEVGPEPPEHETPEEQVDRVALQEHPGQEPPDLPFRHGRRQEEEQAPQRHRRLLGQRAPQAHHAGGDEQASHGGGDPPAELEGIAGPAARHAYPPRGR